MASENNVKAKATNTGALKTRYRGNQAFGSNDFEAWTAAVINKIRFTSVLDVCCGTGNQLMAYGGYPDVKRITGVDISQESLQVAEERFCKLNTEKHLTLKCCKMEEMFDITEIDKQYDLISCFYGLYYADDVGLLVEQIINHLNIGGTFLVVGPYGNNNASLYDILQRYYPIPEFILRSSTTFMREELLKKLQSLPNIVINTDEFVNQIKYPSAEAVMDYWKASTFYSQEHQNDIQLELNNHFKSHDEFIVEKHVMAITASKQ